MKIKKDWLMFGIFMFFFIVVGVRISHSLIAIKNVLNNGVSIRLMEAGKWEKEALIHKDAMRWREIALYLQTTDVSQKLETAKSILHLQNKKNKLASHKKTIQEYCKTDF